MKQLIDYCEELDRLSQVTELGPLQQKLAHADYLSDKENYMVKVTLSQICEQNRKEGIGATLAEKTAASDPKYIDQINLAARMKYEAALVKAEYDAVMTRIKALHILVSAEKMMNNIR